MPEHPLDAVDAGGDLPKLRAMAGSGTALPQIGQHAAEKCVWLSPRPGAVMAAGTREAARYASAVRAKNWREADLLYTASLRRQNPAMLRAVLDAEARARAFSIVLKEELARIGALWRWMDPVELPSYASGTFQSRVERDGGCRGFKALSAGWNHYSGVRPVAMTVPMDAAVRRAVRTVDYTALPRLLNSSEERIGDGKHVRYADETECRLLDGTRVPRGTRILVVRDALDPATDMEWLRSVCDSLAGVAEVSFT